MTMDYKEGQVIPAGEFKTHCLQLLDEVARTGSSFIVTKRGRPVARVTPLAGQEPASLAGSILEEGDLISPIGETWDSDR
jgi:prevent-host-death family protein